MSQKKSFLSREDAEEYYNYLVVNISAQNLVLTDQFHSRKAADNFAQSKNMSHYEIMTRKQFEKFRSEHPELIF